MPETTDPYDLVRRAEEYSKALMKSNPNYGMALKGLSMDIKEYLDGKTSNSVLFVDYEPCRNQETREIVATGGVAE